MEFLVHFHVLLMIILVAVSMSHSLVAGGICRESCGGIPVRYPLSIDDGCGSPYYRNMLSCSADNATLRLRTPSGTYAVAGADYADPHLVVTDPSMWTCDRPFTSVRSAPFSLDTSTRFSLSTRNDYLFFDCDEERVIVAPRPASCDRYPDRCDSAPRAAESVRLMLRHCESYTSVYWRALGDKFPPYDQVPAYGVRVDFEIPVTTRCLQCEDRRRGAGGTCGFDPATRDFVCICDDGRNSTTDCADGPASRHRASAGVVAASVVFSISAAIGITGLVWYIRKIKSMRVVTCGVQSNENRFF
uniref:Wall-associated receptor kinase galacturonan-binding domain-containing protein n=1 Tax=Leersia perrieri TaxID=77586 RepID=A0A0D9VCL4_9ORYZ